MANIEDTKLIKAIKELSAILTDFTRISAMTNDALTKFKETLALKNKMEK